MSIQEDYKKAEYVLPPELSTRPLDILALGSLVLEQVVNVRNWPIPGGQEVTPVTSIVYTAGGCALNVASYSSRMGAKAGVLSTIGGKQFCQEVWDEIERSGVDTTYLREFEDEDGSLIIIIANPEGDWTVLDFLNRAILLREQDIPTTDDFCRTKILHVDGFSYISAGDKEAVICAVERAKQAGCVLSVDGSVPAAKEEPEFLASLYQRADIVFANRFEAFSATNSQNEDEAIEALQSLGPQLCVMKVGLDGSFVITPDSVARVPAYSVDVVDTVAAGDAYIGTLLHCLCQGIPLMQAAERGSAAGALACLGHGSLSSWFGMDDVEALLRRGPEKA